METIKFVKGSVPIRIAAEVYGKDECWIRAVIITGYLDIVTSTRRGKVITSINEMDSRKGRITYYISPRKLYDETGYIWKGRNC